MKTIFLIDGAAGTGKSDMLRYMSTQRSHSAGVVLKHTTRKQRSAEREDEMDLLWPAESKREFESRLADPDFYWYMYGTGTKKESLDYYGFHREDIFEALNDHDIVVIIVRSFGTIDRIKRDFPHQRVVSVFLYSDRDLTAERLRNDNFSDDEISHRLSRQPLAWKDYVKHSSEYDEVIINSSRMDEYERILDALIAKYSVTKPDVLDITRDHSYPLIRPLQGFKDQIERRLSETEFERNVFLMMKFRAENSLVHDFIRDTLRTKGFNCVRADDPYWNITRNVFNPVAVLYCCKFGIALFDEPEPGNNYSPNVAYELGIMHEQGKNCLVLRNSAIPGVPFDLVKELYSDYSSDLQLKNIIGNWIDAIGY